MLWFSPPRFWVHTLRVDLLLQPFVKEHLTPPPPKKCIAQYLEGMLDKKGFACGVGPL